MAAPLGGSPLRRFKGLEPRPREPDPDKLEDPPDEQPEQRPAEQGPLFGGGDPPEPETEKKGKNDWASALTEEFWTAYPRKVGGQTGKQKVAGRMRTRGKAEARYMVLRAKVYGDLVKDYVGRYGREILAHVPHPTTWVNQERYANDSEEWMAPLKLYARNAARNREANPAQLTNRNPYKFRTTGGTDGSDK